MRPLLQVRSKGRPNLLFPWGNKNYRIAVFAQEIDDGSQDKNSGCKNTPVVILKASDKHVIDLTNGQIMGPYNENDKEPQTPLIRPENFVNASSCCSMGVSKVRKGCKCNQKKISRSSILRSYISKKMAIPDMPKQIVPAESFAVKTPLDTPLKAELPVQTLEVKPEALSDQTVQDSLSSHCGSSSILKENGNTGQVPTEEIAQNSMFESLRLSDMPQTYPDASLSEIHGKYPAPNYQIPQMGFPTQDQSRMNMGNGAVNESNVFEVISVPSCSIPGSCGCSSDCSCPSCVVHNNNPAMKAEQSLNFLNNDSQYESNLILKSEPQSNQAEKYARELPRDTGQFTNYLARFTGYDPNPPPFLSELQMELQSVSRAGTRKVQKEEPQQVQSPCSCPDNDCFCTNCETHGIIDGYKLDDIFCTHAPNYLNFPYG